MSGLAEQSLASLLNAVAEATPAPGGGTSSGWTAALGAALVEMAAAIAGDEEAASRSRALRDRLLDLAERELSSYAPVLEARRSPREDPARAGRLEEALLEASRAPAAIAEASAEVAELGAAVARASSPSVRGDAVAGVVLGEAAATAAATLVEINLERRPSAPMLETARTARARAGGAREAALRRSA